LVNCLRFLTVRCLVQTLRSWGFFSLNKDICVFRKDPHGFFAFPVTDAIAPGYSMIIKHPMDFGTMKDKIAANEYKSVTEFKVGYCTS